MTTAGTRLGKIDSVTIYRYVESLPISLAGKDPRVIMPGVTDLAAPDEVNLFHGLPSLTPLQFERLKERLDTLDALHLPDSIAGSQLIYQDSPPVRTDDGRPVRISYAVMTRGLHARSELSNIVTIIPLNTATAPTGLAAKAEAKGVSLSWQAPTAALLPNLKPTLVGYNVYRFPAEGPISELGNAVTPTPVSGTSYTDVPPLGTFRYMVTAVAMAGPPLVQSEPSTPVVAEFKDLLPPPPTETLVALVEEKAIRLAWAPVDAADFAGFKIYRTGGDGKRILLTAAPIKETNYIDTTAPLGDTYTYAVTSIDDKGNESAPTAAAPALLPKP